MDTNQPALPRSVLLQKYYPSLDGLRAIAIFLVYVVHFLGVAWATNPAFQWGWVGVDIFFVLSGFLITGILLDSLGREDYFSNFYIRRTLRIFPLYYSVFFVFLLLGLLPFIHVAWNRYILSYLLYLGNLFRAGGEAGFHLSNTSLPFRLSGHDKLSHVSLGHLWSLCVEEQFYLVWPAVVWLVRSRRSLMMVCGTVMAVAPFGRWMYAMSHPRLLLAGDLYFSTPFRVDTLLAGAFIALWLRGANPRRDKVRNVAYGLLLGSVATFFIAWKLTGAHQKAVISDLTVDTLGFTLIALAAVGLLLLTLDPETRLAKLLRVPALAWFGRISYGMYIFHGFVSGLLTTKLDQLHRFHLSALAVTFIGPAASVGLAWLSFRYIESPFLALKTRLAPRKGAADDPPPYLREQHNET